MSQPGRNATTAADQAESAWSVQAVLPDVLRAMPGAARRLPAFGERQGSERQPCPRQNISSAAAASAGRSCGQKCPQFSKKCSWPPTRFASRSA